MSTINYTYNVIVDRFRQFAAGHFQLRRFTHGEISQADLEKEAEWPWLHVKPRAINYSPGTRSFSFEIFISDLPRDKEDKTGYQAESITDCSLIFQDLINEIYLGNMFGDQVVLSRPVNSEPFVEQYTHTLTGVTGIVELNLDYDWSACSIPASWNYNTPTDSPSDGWGALQFIESLDQNGVYVSLLNDEEAPGNSYYYGTNASGVKGWYAIVDNVGLTCETLPDCAAIISILEDIAVLQTDMLLKANTADLGATAFSNDYNDLDNKPTIPSIAGLVPETRTLTINGATQDLSADRSYTIDKASVNLGNVDNTSDANKPISTATQTALNAKQDTLVSGTNIKTINGSTILGSGDLVVGGSTSLAVGTTPITSGTVGRVLFQGTGNVLQESANLFWDNTNGRLGIGTATPTSKLSVVDETLADIQSTVYNNLANNAGSFLVRKSRGTIASPSAILAGDRLGGFFFSGNNIGSAFYNGCALIAFAAENFTGSAGGSYFAFETTSNSSTLRTEKLRILGNGSVLIGTTTDAGFRLDVNGTARVQGNAQFGTGFYWDNANGRLGIGTSVPAVKFTLQQSNQAYAQINNVDFDIALGIAANTSLIGGMDFKNFNSAGQVRLLARNNQDDYIAINSYGSAATGTLFGINRTNIHAIFGQATSDATKKIAIGTFNSGDVILGTQNTERMRILANGNILINTTTDAGFKLDVSGNSRMNGKLSVNTTVAASAASAILEASSATQGFLPPRMTTTQKNAIATPAAGLVVYDNTVNALNYYNGTAWSSTGLTVTQVTPVTLTAASWTLVSGLYEYTYSNASITSTSIVDVIPLNSTIAIVQAAQVLPETLSSAGSVKLYATNLPTADIIVSINIFN